MKLSFSDLIHKKKSGEKITMLTSYDYPTAQLADAAGIDVLLVGDSVGTNVLGYPDITCVTMNDMIHHVQAVARGTEHAVILADLPFGSCATPENAKLNALRLIAAGANGVKIEVEDNATIIALTAIAEANIPVCGHIGYLPQTHSKAAVIGKELEQAKQLIIAAQKLEKAGACMIVLELIPLQLAAEITRLLSIPTIGIGAGPLCDGQVQVVNDIVGMSPRVFKHAKAYGDVRGIVTRAITGYATDVQLQNFPTDNNAPHMDNDVYAHLQEWISNITG
jgi:3-methyl-2-oxobutanoate hydroxymethyltransferase